MPSVTSGVKSLTKKSAESDKFPVSKLKSIIERFADVKVLVVGDVMLDRYWWGKVQRISPEAPVPVVNLEKTSLVPGGAANVAANITGLGAKPFLFGIIGEDSEGELFAQILNSIDVSSKFLLREKNRPTTIKTRIVAHNQQVVRIDQENIQPISSATQKNLINQFKELIEDIDIVIVSDYAKGVITEDLASRLITTARRSNKLILVDPKGRDFSKYRGATLLTPNKQEAATACNFEPNNSDLIEKAGLQLLKNLDSEAVLITQGDQGMTLFEKNKPPFHLNTSARAVYDVTGAGDTVIASLGVAVGAGADLVAAAEIANINAGLVVEEVGTTAISLKRLREAIEIDQA